jgi:hypothetical protein
MMAINVLISSLALFLTPDEQRRVRMVVAAQATGYSPDLLIQGIISTVCDIFSLLFMHELQSFQMVLQMK